MQDFSKRIGWTRGGLYVSALLLAITGILCIAIPGMFPEALHKPILPEGLTPGGILAGVSLAITGIVQLAAYAKAGGSRTCSGFLVLTGIFELFIAVALFTDPIFGTLSYEWVCAVMFGLWGACAFLEGLAGSRVVGYSGWWLQVLIGLVEVCLAVGVLLDSSNSHLLAGLALIAGAIEVAAIPLMCNSIKLPSATAPTAA